MTPFGKTCLISCESEENISKEGEIFVVNNIDKVKDGNWKGIIKEYGTLVTEDDLRDLPKIGECVVMSYGKENSDKGGTKLVIGGKVYYIRNIEEILGVLDD